MTPNPNPSPELWEADRRLREVKRMATRASDNILHELNRDPNWSPQRADYQTLMLLLQNIASTTGADAALSPQTLPAPGEVPKGMKPWTGGDGAPDDWDGGPVLRADGHTEHSDDITRQQWRSPIPRCKWNIVAYTPTPATVAAANDEGVAEAFEAAAKVCDDLASTAASIQAAIELSGGEAPIKNAQRETAETLSAAIRLLSQGGGKAERYRHVKRGTVYEVVGRAQLQIATGDVCEGSELVIYRADDGKLWARESGEFNDGRFESLATSRSQHEGAGR